MCPDRPWSTSGLRIQLTKPLPDWTLYPSRADFPWGVWTADGRRCVSYASTATDKILGRPVTYGCAGGGFLAGYLDTRTQPWTARFASGLHVHRFTVLAVSDVWW
jgi:hypothetical protein